LSFEIFPQKKSDINQSIGAESSKKMLVHFMSFLNHLKVNISHNEWNYYACKRIAAIDTDTKGISPGKYIQL